MNVNFWDHILEGRSTVICLGAGGVGKTTIAAAIAFKEAESGRRVACLTIDPARRLADALGVASVDSDGRLTDISHVLSGDSFNKKNNKGRLFFGMLDSKATFDKMVRDKAASLERAEKILNNRLYKYVSGSLSGMQEYMALERLSELREDDRFDLIVLDTPPSGNAESFFTAPGRIMTALDGPLVKMMRGMYNAQKNRFNILGRWSFSLFNALSKITGAALLDEIMDFIDALSELFGNFFERALNIENLLKSRDVSVVMVTTPDKPTVSDADNLKLFVEKLGYHLDAIIFNRCSYPRVKHKIPDELCSGVKESIEKINTGWNNTFTDESAVINAVKERAGFDILVALIPLLPFYSDKIEFLKSVVLRLKDV